MALNFSLKQFIAGSCYSYMLGSGNEALVIDPHISLEAEYLAYLKKNQLSLKYIVDTHTHADHFSLAAVLKKNLHAPVLMHEKAISQVADKRLRDNDEIPLGTERIKVLYAPGHTDDTINLCVQGKVFTADVLLIGSAGRSDFQNGSPESMFDTLQRLKALPEETEVYPGHDYHGKRSSSIAQEKKSNPVLQETDKTAFADKMREKKLPKPFNIENIVRVNQKGEAGALEMISAHTAYELATKNNRVKFLDVRSASEYSQVHIKDAIHIPIDMLGSKVNELSGSGDSYIMVCHTGNRAAMAADMLIQSGTHQVKVMTGGMVAWQKERLAVIKGSGGMSLERQVRCVAGSLVLLGVILAYFHPAFMLISAFVGTGLLFAGLTDSCAMGMLLMKLPYNKNLYKTKLGGGCSIG
jgi:glyoxylase-like metal-dependent hydrolase (beta-lactamase superfamily II)/rhodanese-related sulfurtransferase